MGIRDIIEQDYPDHTLVFLAEPYFDRAILGISVNGDLARVVYSIQELEQALMEVENLSEEDAIDYLEYNTLNTWVGEETPIYVHEW